ncbi:nesprin-2-like [Stigmatopora argus]
MLRFFRMLVVALETPAESSHEEKERLKSARTALEENRTVLGEFLGIRAELEPRLSRTQREATENVLQARHREWREVEIFVERALHHADVLSRSCSSLLLELSYLRARVESISNDLEDIHPQGSPWDFQKAEQLMMGHAEVKAARMKYLLLKERSEDLPSSLWPKEAMEIKQALLIVKDQLCLTDEWISSSIQNCSHPTVKNLLTLVGSGLSWTKQMECEIEGRREKISLLPEEVHRQLRTFKKLQSEVTDKQRELKSQLKAAAEHLVQTDQNEEMSAVHLEELLRSISEKLSRAVGDVESALQVREKMSEQIAELDSWVERHLERDTTEDYIRTESQNPSKDQIQELLIETEKQFAACEVLFMKSKDMASELSVTEDCRLFDKLTNLREDINAIANHQRDNKNQLEEHVRFVESTNGVFIALENSMGQMQEELNKMSFPITRESLQVLESFKYILLEHKSKIDILPPREEKSSELYSAICQIRNNVTSLQSKAKDHEKYLSTRKLVEDLKEAVEEQLNQSERDGSQVLEKYKSYQKLLLRLTLIQELCKEVGAQLQKISTDLHPSQSFSEQQRLQENEDSLRDSEMRVLHELGILESALRKDLDLDSERKVMRVFLEDVHVALQNPPLIKPKEMHIIQEYRRVLFLKMTVESRMRILQHRKEDEDGTRSSELEDLKNVVLRQCDSRMDDISDARTSLRNYSHTVMQALEFFRDFEVSLLTLPGVAGACSEKLEDTRELLASLEDRFQTFVDELSQVSLHSFLSPEDVEPLQESILSLLLVRISTLKAKGYLQLENLSSCAEKSRKYSKCHLEICQRMKEAETVLEHFISQKVDSLADCDERHQKLQVLQEDLDLSQKCLEETVEWCSDQSCRGRRDLPTATAWRRIGALRLCSQRLIARLGQRIVEWRDVSDAVENASAVLRKLEEELPKPAPIWASGEEVLDLRQRWGQYQDRLECEHHAVSALELRVANLFGVPANLEQAPLTPLCQQLQAMQALYQNIKKRTREGLEQMDLELEEKRKMQEELQVVWVWLTAADSLLAEIEPSSSVAAELQEIHGQLRIQKALVHRIEERLRSKYFESDMVPVEIHCQMEEIQKTMQDVQVKVEEAIEKSGPIHKIAAKLLETQAGLRSVQKRLEDRSSNVDEAELAQKMVWDELREWHSCLMALEADVQALEKPQEVLSLTERLVEVQQLHVQLVNQAEEKTTLLSQMQTWLQEHREMITGARSWMSESQEWLGAARTYATANCLREQVQALKTVLDDSAQIRSTLQGFAGILDQMSQVVNVSSLREQLLETEGQVAAVQDSFSVPLCQLEHAAAEVERMETEVRKMETNVSEIKTIFCSPETFPSPKEKHLKMLEQRIQSMRSAIADIQKARVHLCLPEKGEDNLTVFIVIDQLQTLLLELEKKVPALFIQESAAKPQSAQPSASQAEVEEASSEDADTFLTL